MGSSPTTSPEAKPHRWRRKYPRRAVFAGICTICSDPIEVSDEIAWSPGRPADHWNCYVNGHDERRGPNDYPPKENTIGQPERVGLSDRARKDFEILGRLHPQDP